MTIPKQAKANDEAVESMTDEGIRMTRWVTWES